jgi:hypothetical protein
MIDKSADQTELTLSTGQQFLVNYQVDVDIAGFTDSDWAVSGEITIENNTPFDATIESVADIVSTGIAATVDCEEAFPYTLPKGELLTCTYSSDLPDATQRTNTATVLTSGVVGGGEDEVDVIFSDPTTEIDRCVDVSDTYAGVLDTVCTNEAPSSFSYTLTIGPYSTCGEYKVENTASFVTDDYGIIGSDSWTVTVDVPCVGCTLTQGYWKTHSEYGPAPYDDTWALLGADTPFFLSGQTYYEVLWALPGGNAYYILAQQYIAAKLNALNGSDFTAAQSAFDQAEALFETYTPAQVANLKGAAKHVWINLATILDNYNNGLIGPGHCDE